VKRISRCQKHVGMEIDTYCKTCNDAVCAMCAVEKHPKHDFCLLSQVTGPLQLHHHHYEERGGGEEGH